MQAEVKELEAALEEADTDDPAASQAGQMRLSQLNRSSSSLVELKRLLASGDLESLSRTLSSSSSVRSGLSATCSELFVEFSAAIEVERREKKSAFEDKMTEFGKQLGSALVNAETPGDLDKWFGSVERLKLEANKYRYSGSINTNALNNYTNMISTWQDYLNYLARGDGKSADRSLDNLNRLVTTTPVVPRSKLLEMKNRVFAAAKNRSPSEQKSEPELPVYTVSSVVDDIKSYDDLEVAMTKLIELTKDSKQSRDAHTQITNIKRLNAANKLIDEGSPVLAMAGLKNYRPSGSNSEWYKFVSEELNRRAYYHSIPEEFRPEAADMPLEKLVESAAAHMSKKKQWQPLWQFLKIVEQNYNRNVMPGLSSDTQAIANFLLAQRYEETGQLASALTSYNSVLRGTGAFGPYEEAKERVQYLLNQRSEELLADQKRVAEVPVRQSSSSRYYPGGMRMDSREIDQLIEQKLDAAIAKQLILLLTDEKKLGDELMKEADSVEERRR